MSANGSSRNKARRTHSRRGDRAALPGAGGASAGRCGRSCGASRLGAGASTVSGRSATVSVSSSKITSLLNAGTIRGR